MTEKYKRLLHSLCRRANIEQSAIDFIEPFPLTAMNDGGMGSFSIGVQEYDGVYDFYEIKYTDTDNILCMITLFVNAAEIPYEVEIWKGDFSEIIEYPSDNKLYDGKFIEH